MKYHNLKVRKVRRTLGPNLEPLKGWAESKIWPAAMGFEWSNPGYNLGVTIQPYTMHF